MKYHSPLKICLYTVSLLGHLLQQSYSRSTVSNVLIDTCSLPCSWVQGFSLNCLLLEVFCLLTTRLACTPAVQVDLCMGSSPLQKRVSVAKWYLDFCKCGIVYMSLGFLQTLVCYVSAGLSRTCTKEFHPHHSCCPFTAGLPIHDQS